MRHLFCFALLLACGGNGGSRDAGAPDASASDASPPDAAERDSAPPPDSATASPGDWRLPEGYYEPAKMPMVLVHPRPDAPDWAYASNAYPGLRWEIPIVVQGGAWPFQYAIVDDGGARGLSIGAELTRIEEDGFVVHRITEEYGTLWWDDPVTGQYAIRLRVTDQEGSSLDVDLTLKVGTEGWVFVDAENGDDDSGDGSMGRPFATLKPLYSYDRSTPSSFAQHRVVLAGLVPMDGNRLDSGGGNLRIADDDRAPRIYIGWPGRDAVLEAFEGKISLDAPDFYLAHLELRHRADYVPDTGSYLHMITAWDNTDRFTMHRVHVSRFQGVPYNEGYGNSGFVMFVDNGRGRAHVAMVGNTFSGPSGVITSTYSLRESVFERNVVRDAELSLGDGSVWSLIYLKRGNEHVSVRANEIWQNNTWDPSVGLSALGMDQSRLVEFAYNVLRAPWDDGRHGALKVFTNSHASSYTWTEDTPVWIYRNTLSRRVSWEGANLDNAVDGLVRFERNALHEGTFPVHARVLLDGNLEGMPIVDEQMQLLAPLRAEYLGRVGAEIAAPAL